MAFANRAPAFLAFVYVGYSLGYLISQIGLKHNPEWLCIDYNEDTLLTAQEGQRSQPCIIIFFLVYFFGSATSTWWTVVAFSWALAQYSSPKKSAMDTISMFCHLYGWGIPAILTLVAILQHNIEADELTSVCLPGALRDDNNFLAFIVIPEGREANFFLKADLIEKLFFSQKEFNWPSALSCMWLVFFGPSFAAMQQPTRPFVARLKLQLCPVSN